LIRDNQTSCAFQLPAAVGVAIGVAELSLGNDAEALDGAASVAAARCTVSIQRVESFIGTALSWKPELSAAFSDYVVTTG
jgi:hypothetical protein